MVAQQPSSGYKKPAAPSASQLMAAVTDRRAGCPIGGFKTAQPEMNH
jgi:hypothetical protein